MVKAYVLIETEGRDPHMIANDLMNVDEVENAHLIYGEYDLIAYVNGKTLVDLKELALGKIGKIKGVIKTSTLIVADED